MTIFQKELNNLLGNSELLTEQKFAGNALFGKLTDDTVLKAEFVTCGYADHYSAIRLQVINRHEGAVDTTLVNLKDILPRSDNKFPYIWTNSGKSDWYGSKPSVSEYKIIRENINNYLEAFSDISMTQDAGIKMGM